MYKVLIADDERIIREGIAKIVNWKSLNLQLIDMASNGKEAYEKTQTNPPDIIITDIKMPGMNGLDLIEKINNENNKIKFIVLSGYGDFDFAKRAMKYGIKYYLLKPTSEDEIKKVLALVIKELSEEEKKFNFLESIKKNLNTMIPLAKKQFFKDRVINKIYSNKELNFYKKVFEIKSQKIIIILFELDDNYKIEEMLALEKIADKTLNSIKFFLSSYIKNTLTVMLESINQKELINSINIIKKTFLDYYQKKVTVAISKEDTFDKLHNLYQEAKELLKYKFYLGEGCIITKNDIKENKDYRVFKDYNFIIEQVAISVKCGDIESVKNEIDEFLKELKNEKLERDIILSYSMELLLSIVRNNIDNIKENSTKNINDYFKEIIDINKFVTINEIKEKIEKIALEITEANYNKFTQKKNRHVQLLIKKIEENLENENLSLKWLAKNMIFTNEDYLSKLFKKDMNKNFSQYLTEQRMERAKKLLENPDDDMIYNVASKVGFGDNSQYFSQVFKNYTGFSPTDYRKKIIEKNL